MKGDYIPTNLSSSSHPSPRRGEGGRRVIVIGAGPAGLMAAGIAAESGAKTLLLEKMHRPGQKLRLTGKGRCNLTNTAPLLDFIEHFGPGGRFLRQAFSQFFSSDLKSFLKNLGVRTVTEPDGRVFPAKGDARDVAEALVQWVTKCGAVLRNDSPVARLIVEKKRMVGVQLSSKSSSVKRRINEHFPAGEILRADAIVVACGGASYPSTGSSGDGYRLAESVGHSIVPIRPALVSVETAGDIAPRLQGVSLRETKVRVLLDEKKQAEVTGALLFTHFGLSGPMILSWSRALVDSLRSGRSVILSIDLVPELDEHQLDERILLRFRENSRKKFGSLLGELLPKKMIPVCADLIGVPLDKSGHQITSAERKRLRLWLKDFQLKVVGYRSFTEAMITAGGVNTKEVDPRTMESRLVKGLYFAGEVLDIDADTGGYNLQTAFSTGWLAGKSAVSL